MMQALNLAGLAHLLPADFHFLRPEWLLAILPGLLLAWLASRRMKRGRSDWAGVVDPHLLRHLAVRGKQGGGRWPVPVLLLGWALAALAMAGPTWQKLPSPALDQLDPTVLVLNLNRSMDAPDEAPSRLVAARHKMEDILARMRGGQVGLIIYADVPFVAAPLTEDTRVVSAMLPELSTNLMPEGANRPDNAILQAGALLQGAGATHGRIILLTDGLGDDAARTQQAAAAVGRAGFAVSVIGVGGASPVAGTSSPPMDEARLKALASAGKGTFSPLSIDSRDLDTIFAQPVRSAATNPLQDSGMTADTWLDMGPWLLLPLLLLGALAFRRGWIAVLFFAVLLPLTTPTARAQEQTTAPQAAPAPQATPAPEPAQTSLWRNLWQRPDQQAAEDFARGDYARAAGRFEDPNWRASALYKAGDYEAAASAYDRTKGASYNQGNALARAGKLEDALAAYDEALAADPQNEDALYNRDLVEQLLKKEQEEQQNQSGGGGGGGGGGGDSQQQDQQSQGGQGQQDQQNEQQQDKGAQNPSPQQQNKGEQEQPDGQKPGDTGNGTQETPQSGKDGAPDPQSGEQDQSNTAPDQNQQQDAPKEPDQGPDAPQPDPAGKDESDGPGGKEPEPEPQPNQPGENQQQPQPQNEGEQPQGAQPEPAQPDPAGAEGAEPQQAEQPAQPGGAGGAAGGEENAGPPGGMGNQMRPMSEQDQNSEQALRMVPDDPSGLLRARIRAYYSGLGVTTEPEEPR